MRTRNHAQTRSLVAIGLSLATIVAVDLVWQHARPALAATDESPVAQGPDRDPEWILPTHGMPEPSREMRLEAYLTRLAYELSDAVFDRRELPGNRFARLTKLAHETTEASIEQLDSPTSTVGTDDDWKYAATLLWIGHRETRLCSNPRKLGNEDNGRAHGYFQVWNWKGLDPYEPATAMDMLVNKASSWSLPQNEPWTGYPEAAAYIKEHPFE